MRPGRPRPAGPQYVARAADVGAVHLLEAPGASALPHLGSKVVEQVDPLESVSRYGLSQVGTRMGQPRPRCAVPFRQRQRPTRYRTDLADVRVIEETM